MAEALKLTPMLRAMLERINRHSGYLLMLAITTGGSREEAKLNKLRGAGYVVKCQYPVVIDRRLGLLAEVSALGRKSHDPHRDPGGGGMSDFNRCIRCIAHELERDECFYAGRCLLTVCPPGEARGLRPPTVGDEFIKQFGDPETWNAIHAIRPRKARDA